MWRRGGSKVHTQPHTHTATELVGWFVGWFASASDATAAERRSNNNTDDTTSRHRLGPLLLHATSEARRTPRNSAHHALLLLPTTPNLQHPHLGQGRTPNPNYIPLHGEPSARALERCRAGLGARCRRRFSASQSVSKTRLLVPSGASEIARLTPESWPACLVLSPLGNVHEWPALSPCHQDLDCAVPICRRGICVYDRDHHTNTIDGRAPHSHSLTPECARTNPLA